MFERRFHLFTVENTAVTVKFAVVVVATVAFFFQDLSIVFQNALFDESLSYILVVPFLLSYLVYRKRKMIAASFSAESSKFFGVLPVNGLIGAVLAAISFLLYWFGSYTFTPLDYHMLAMPLFVFALVLIMFNTKIAIQLFIPLLFLFLLVPPPAEIIYQMGSFLSVISSEISFNLLRLLGFGVTLGAENGTPTIYLAQQNGTPLSFQVDIACSGVYSQMGFIVFAFFIAYLVRDKLWKKPLIFLIGLPLIYLLNVLRISSIVVIGYYQGYDLALSVFHLLGGWVLIFLGTLVLLVVSEKLVRIRLFAKKKECVGCTTTPVGVGFCADCGRIQKPALPKPRWRDAVKIVVVGLIVVLLISIQVPVFALTAGPAEIVSQTPQGENVPAAILPDVSGYWSRFEYRDTDFEKLAGQDASLIYAYYPYNDSEEVIYVTIEIASTASSLHRWETCLITTPLERGYQPQVRQIELTDVLLVDNPPIKGRYFAFQYTSTNHTRALVYWFETSQFKTNMTSEEKHVKISVISDPNSLDDVPRMKAIVMEFSEKIAGHWQPLKTWSQVALLMSQGGDGVAVILVVVLAMILVVLLLQRRQRKTQNINAYQKLSEDNKRIIDAVFREEKNGLSTLNAVAQDVNNGNGTSVSRDDVLQRLRDAEQAGFLTGDIGNMDDEPLHIWRTGRFLFR